MAKKFPILYHKGKSGAVYSWQVSSEGDTITSVAGQVSGLKTTTSKRVEQKNIGKSNETSLEDQADKEAEAMWRFKIERKYSDTQAGAQIELELPMLAKEFDKFKKKLSYPVHVQPKLDGVRALAKWENGKVVLTSRSGKPWNAVPHINKALEKFLPKDSVFDGELYIHGVTFQAITRLVKKLRPESIEVKYHVYDIPDHKGDSDLPWSDRRIHLDELRKSTSAVPVNVRHIVAVESEVAKNEAEVIAIHDKLVHEGYEGCIVRTLDGRYLYGYRSDDLLKVKNFDDGEFEVVGSESGSGRYENAAIWICKTSTGTEFKANMKTSIANKEEYLKHAKSYVGKKLTVRYFGKSEDGNPRFPVGIAFRDEKDLPLQGDLEHE
jgi:DNA ligase 1